MNSISLDHLNHTPPMSLKSSELIYRNKLSALILESIINILSCLSLDTINSTRYVKVINGDGKISFVAAKHLVQKMDLLKGVSIGSHRHNQNLQKKIIQILDPFNSGIIKIPTIEKFLQQIDTINWNAYDGMDLISEKLKENKPLSPSEKRGFEMILLHELEKIKTKELIQSTKSFPIHWDDFIQLSKKDKQPYIQSFTDTYGQQHYNELKTLTDSSQVSQQQMDQLDEIFNHAMDQFEEPLQQGDLIFFKLDSTKFSPLSLLSKSTSTDYIIMQGQKFAKAWVKGPQERLSNTFIHVGMIVKKEGRAFLIEATPGDYGDDVRMVELRGINGRLGPNSKQGFRITRLKDNEIAKNASQIALEVADEVQYDSKGAPIAVISKNKKEDPASTKGTQFKYNKSKAVGSIFKTGSIKERTKLEIFETYAQTQREGLVLLKNGKQRDFYCSYFTGFNLQYAEACPIIDQILAAQPDQPNFSAMSDKDIHIWAKSMLNLHGTKFNDMKMVFNPENLSPQKLRAIIHTHPEMFEDVLSLSPPKKSLMERS